jgi:mono/diheme cytochrome c family protein
MGDDGRYQSLARNQRVSEPFRPSWWAWVGLVAVVTGCRPAMIPEFQSSTQVGALPAELQTAVKAELEKYTGTFATPKLLADVHAPAADLPRGQAVYQEYCVQCHGLSGGGDGVTATYMYPRPRDYRKGLFKFASTPYGSRPLRSDLSRTIQRGVRGTSMPAFPLLSPADLDAVVDYVIMLSRRGELEEQLSLTADSEEEVDPEIVADELVPLVVGRWAEAELAQVRPLSLPPKFTDEHVTRGRQAFLTKGCSKCHGEDGRGQTADNRGTDAWGFPTRAADLTSGLLHGGAQPTDVYVRIYNGINGTPMPSFAIALQQEPETVWDLVAYVMHVSSRRRVGETPDPGMMTPYPKPDLAAATPAAQE